MNEQPTPAGRTFSLRTIFKVILLSSVALAAIRFMAVYPEMIAPLTIMGVVIALLLTPKLVERLEPAGVRFALGCFVLPLVYVVAAILFAIGILFLSEALAP